MTDIVGKRYWFFLLSAIVIIPGIISLAVFGLKPGIDFQSGTNITMQFTATVDQTAVRQEIGKLGYPDATVQHTGAGDFLVRLPQITRAQGDTLVNDMATAFNTQGRILDFATVSPLVASQTARNAAIAVAVAAVFIILYISFAFRKMPKPFRWGTCAVIALVHDLIVVLGLFSILGWAAGVQVDAIFITGMLTVAGYSVHDTIVVFDRIRENVSLGLKTPFAETVNYSILQTFARSLNTSLTTLFVLLALFFLGGATIHYFILILLVGIVTGTYSSICNASQLLVVWERREWNNWFKKKQVENKPA